MAPAKSQPPAHIFGLYSGVVVKSERDQIEIGLGMGFRDQSPDTVQVTYTVHRDGRECVVWGHGTWADGKLVAHIGADTRQERPLCRLILRFSKDTIVVSDPTFDCRRLVCGYGGLDGAVLKKMR